MLKYSQWSSSHTLVHYVPPIIQWAVGIRLSWRRSQSLEFKGRVMFFAEFITGEEQGWVLWTVLVKLLYVYTKLQLIWSFFEKITLNSLFLTFKGSILLWRGRCVGEEGRSLSALLDVCPFVASLLSLCVFSKYI